MRNIAIIGGGASGIAAAITAAESGARVTLLEAGKRIGRSILASGNGRCNWSNALVEANAYANPAFVGQAFAACPPAQVHEWFSQRGLRSFAEGDGRLYPQANKASSVLDVLRFRLEELDVEVVCECPVAGVRPAKGGWMVQFEEGAPRRFDTVLVACGGGIVRGILPEGYEFVPRRPRLCPLRTDRASVKGLDNIRVKARATLVRAGAPQATEAGEVQFRSFGLSGIAVFNLSRFAQVGDTVLLDFVPRDSEDELALDLEHRARRFASRPLEHQLAGMVLPAVARALANQAHLDANRPLPPDAVGRLVRCLKAYELRVEGFEEASAQVRQGGVAVFQVNPATMESLRDSGLFILGEALDVDGPCGGYNLHWAWTCGLLAGAASAVPAAPAAPANARPRAISGEAACSR